MKKKILGLVLTVMLVLQASGFSLSESEVTMPNIPKIKIGNTSYDLKDTEARNQITELKSALNKEPANFRVSERYINTSGDLQNNAAWRTTGFIPVFGNTGVYIEGVFSNLAGAGYNLGLYAENQSFIKGYTFGTETQDGRFFDITGAAYIRMSNINTNSADYAFVSSWKNTILLDVLTRKVTPTFSDVGYLQTNGVINASATDWNTTPYIPVSELGMYCDGYFYSLAGAGYNVCLYGKDKSFIRGFNPAADMSVFDISEAAYVRLSSHDPYLSVDVLLAYPKGDTNKEVVVDVNGGGDYTSLLAAMKATSDTTTIRLKAGVYDLIEEYKAYYGSDFFDNYDGYAAVSDPYYRGLWLSTGRKIIGEAGAVIKCEYTGSNTKVATLFSCIANAGNILIENVTIQHANLRYAIHDDYGATPGQTIEFRNIHFIGHSNGAPIGAGLGYGSTVYIDGCVFEGNRQPWDINYHGSNSGATDNVNKVYVTNCRGNHGCGFWPNGPSLKESECYVSNCKFSEITLYRPSGQDESQFMNMALYAWCNETDQ